MIFFLIKVVLHHLKNLFKKFFNDAVFDDTDQEQDSSYEKKGLI